MLCIPPSPTSFAKPVCRASRAGATDPEYGLRVRRIDHPLGPEELTPGSVFEVHDGERILKVRVPQGATFGTKLRVGDLLVKLVRRAAEPVCEHARVEYVLLAEGAVEAMVDLLVESTRDNVELAGTCRVREPADYELSGLDDPDPERIWVIEGFETSERGTSTSVVVPAPGNSPLDWHTHPGLRGGFSGFSKTDERSVTVRRRPMVVIGYTVLGPQFLGAVAFPLGGWGLAASLGLSAWFQMEARRQETEPRLLRFGAAGRVYFPDERTVPILLADAPGWRRAFEKASFQVDQVATKASQATEEVKDRLLLELRKRLVR